MHFNYRIPPDFETGKEKEKKTRQKKKEEKLFHKRKKILGLRKIPP